MLGLDIGHASVKAVVLRSRGRSVECLGAGHLPFLSEERTAELPGSLACWLRGAGWDSFETTASVPQFLATVEHAQFPKSSAAALRGMASFEVRHLAALSDDDFVSDFTFSGSKGEDSLSVLIAMCRQSVVLERIAWLEQANVKLVDLALSGSALATAFLHLHPRSKNLSCHQLVLDIGSEVTTIAVVAGGKLIYSSAVMVGADAFRKPAESQADEFSGPVFLTVSAMAPGAAGTAVAAALATAIKSALEDGLSEMGSDVVGQPVAFLALCGGGVQVPGLSRYLERAFDCPGIILGVPVPDHADPDPSLVTAFGLALHGLGQSPFPLSMAPSVLKRKTRCRRRFPWLLAASAILAAFLVVFEVDRYQRLRRHTADLTRNLRDLTHCQELIPRLDAAQQAIERKHLTLAPIVAKANRQHRYAATINRLVTAHQDLQHRLAEDESWVVYLADNESFQARYSAKAAGVPGRLPAANGAAVPAPPNPFPEAVPAPSAILARTVADVKPPDYMVTGLYATAGRENIFRLIKPLVHSLTRPDGESAGSTALFANVDLMSDVDAAVQEEIFSGWAERARQQPSAGHRHFLLKLPFSCRDVERGVLPPEPGDVE